MPLHSFRGLPILALLGLAAGPASVAQAEVADMASGAGSILDQVLRNLGEGQGLAGVEGGEGAHPVRSIHDGGCSGQRASHAATNNAAYDGTFVDHRAGQQQYRNNRCGHYAAKRSRSAWGPDRWIAAGAV